MALAIDASADKGRLDMSVYKGIAEVTRLMGKDGIGKDRKNAQQGYSFRGIDDIYNALNGCLVAANLCIIPRIISREVAERQSKNGGTLFYVTVHAEYDIVSAVDGSKHTASAYGEAMDSADKATNKATSAAYKYLAMQLFCIPTEGDNDADAHTPEVAPVEYNPVSARAAIAALPRCTAADKTKADGLTERDDLAQLYQEVRARQA
jgi:hypothetical protein